MFNTEENTGVQSICLSFKDGLISFPTYENAKAGEVVYVVSPFETENPVIAKALIMNLTPNVCEALLFEDIKVQEGWLVLPSGELTNLNAGLHLFNSIINALGEIVYTESELVSEEDKELMNDEDNGLVMSFSTETRAPNILDRKSVHQPLHSGLKSVDSLIPIGLGQRELIIGDRQTGKSTVTFDLWQNQTNLNLFLSSVFDFKASQTTSLLRELIWSIYVAIGQKRSKVMGLFQEAKTRNMLTYGSIVAATASESAPMQFLAPYTGCALGEYIRDVLKGHVVLVYDDLSKHAVAYRQMSLLLRRPPGREAFPGDVFLHSFTFT